MRCREKYKYIDVFFRYYLIEIVKFIHLVEYVDVLSASVESDEL